MLINSAISIAILAAIAALTKQSFVFPSPPGTCKGALTCIASAGRRLYVYSFGGRRPGHSPM